MKSGEFYDAVAAHDDLKLVGVQLNKFGKSVIVVEHTPSKLTTEARPESIEATEWFALEEILTGKRESKVLGIMARIVGYYSVTENWNRSKLGELDARRRGNYGVPEVRDEATNPLHDVRLQDDQAQPDDCPPDPGQPIRPGGVPEVL